MRYLTASEVLENRRVHLCTGIVGARSAPYQVERAQGVAAGSICYSLVVVLM